MFRGKLPREFPPEPLKTQGRVREIFDNMGEEETKKGGGNEVGAGGAGGAQVQEELPSLDFSTLILSLSSSVLMNLGIIENPVTRKKEKDLAAAKQTIDLIALLKDKTRGNLTEEEKKLLDDVLHELQLQYCRTAGV